MQCMELNVCVNFQLVMLKQLLRSEPGCAEAEIWMVWVGLCSHIEAYVLTECKALLSSMGPSGLSPRTSKARPPSRPMGGYFSRAIAYKPKVRNVCS